MGDADSQHTDPDGYRQALEGQPGSPSGRSTLGTAALKYVFGASLAALAFMATYAPAAVEFPAAELRDILALGAAVHTVPFVAALVLLRSKVRNAVLALIVLGSVWTAYLVHTDLWLTGSRAVFWLSALAVLGGIFVAFELIDENRWVSVTLPSVAATMLLLAVNTHLLPNSGDGSHEDRFYAEQIRLISFEETPNVYFIAFDGLGPQSLGQQYLDIETTDLIELINAEFRRLPNMFAESRWSRDSLHILASLDRDIFWETRERDGRIGHLTGEFPTPLYDILHENGYETTFGYHSSNFGRTKGPYLDNLLIGEVRPVCGRLATSIFDYAFWGYCNLADTESRDSSTDYKATHADMMHEVISIADRDGPQFAFAYLRLPTHTWSPFDYSDTRHVDDYRARYVNFSNQAAVLLAELLEALEARDPEAILFVFGDHGPRLTEGMEFGDDPDFFVKDNLGVLGGIWPPDACESEFDEAQAKGWMTTLDAVHAVLRCLSGGEEALVEPRTTIMRNYDRIPNDDPERSFADFLYE